MELEDAHTCVNTITLRALCSPVQTEGEHDLEYSEMLRATWGAFLSNKCLWQVPGNVQEHIHVLHLGVFQVREWASGTRHWTSVELRGLQIVRVWMTRRIAGLYSSETWVPFVQQTMRWACNLWASAKVLSTEDTVETQW